MNNKTYIGFLDILGFSDLINNNDSETITKLLKKVFMDSIGASFFQLYKEEIAMYKLEKPRLVIVSDSIILWTKSNSFFDFVMICQFTGSILRNAFDAGIPLRGGIVYDSISELTLNDVVPSLDYFQSEINVKSSILIGKGIVNAYKLEGIQDWSGCIIDETSIEQAIKSDSKASKFIDVMKNWAQTIADYPVPLKNGTNKNCTVVNWTNAITRKISDKEIFDSFKKHNKSINSESVKLKIKNTIEFNKKMRKTPRNNLYK